VKAKPKKRQALASELRRFFEECALSYPPRLDITSLASEAHLALLTSAKCGMRTSQILTE
jgi:hypothetical protein